MKGIASCPLKKDGKDWDREKDFFFWTKTQELKQSFLEKFGKKNSTGLLWRQNEEQRVVIKRTRWGAEAF